MMRRWDDFFAKNYPVIWMTGIHFLVPCICLLFIVMFSLSWQLPFVTDHSALKTFEIIILIPMLLMIITWQYTRFKKELQLSGLILLYAINMIIYSFVIITTLTPHVVLIHKMQNFVSRDVFLSDMRTYLCQITDGKDRHDLNLYSEFYFTIPEGERDALYDCYNHSTNYDMAKAIANKYGLSDPKTASLEHNLRTAGDNISKMFKTISGNKYSTFLRSFSFILLATCIWSIILFTASSVMEAVLAPLVMLVSMMATVIALSELRLGEEQDIMIVYLIIFLCSFIVTLFLRQRVADIRKLVFTHLVNIGMIFFSFAIAEYRKGRMFNDDDNYLSLPYVEITRISYEYFIEISILLIFVNIFFVVRYYRIMNLPKQEG